LKKSRLLRTVRASLAAVSINADAVVVNTLTGVDYEWLELTDWFNSRDLSQAFY